MGSKDVEALERQRRITEGVLFQVGSERIRQDTKWGEQNHDVGKWSLILGEEFGEFCKAVLQGRRQDARKELIHVAAVAVATVECMDRTSI